MYKFMDSYGINYSGCQVLDGNMETILSLPNIWKDNLGNIFLSKEDGMEDVINCTTLTHIIKGDWLMLDRNSKIEHYRQTDRLLAQRFPTDIITIYPREETTEIILAENDDVVDRTSDFKTMSRDDFKKLPFVYHHVDGRIGVLEDTYTAAFMEGFTYDFKIIHG